MSAYEPSFIDRDQRAGFARTAAESDLVRLAETHDAIRSITDLDVAQNVLHNLTDSHVDAVRDALNDEDVDL